jgi:hypothetical protein
VIAVGVPEIVQAALIESPAGKLGLALQIVKAPPEEVGVVAVIAVARVAVRVAGL